MAVQQKQLQTALAEKQGLQLQELMGINSSQVVAVTNNPEVPFPVACRTFTLLVIPECKYA
ncbi:MAG: hypothetical protein H0A75_01410 [Candidatus Methanofishera endochildressiae]|uniref:Uncharacterized protein n=1 Tax=Candidatus Methanofishera endochildressiae TaxID=2738884 RepID=A0A7Z0MN81_9GAMM|nr:hypothetical protein [Candidatus Methanofishera endochildressiae]